ncbi:MAG: hypothetical protein KDA85_00515 [Planctomycetaceae bacterium]|nr:hypothetical protein [Planctomycetaceae bacterium]
MSERPYEPPIDQEGQPQHSPAMSGKDTYNVVSDTVTGVNLRWSDNKFQALCILVSVLLLAFVGAAAAALNSGWQLPWYGGAGIGASAGLVIGTFGSGIFLMIYRAVRHIRGQHD